jgi:hypothetical protein
MNYGQFEKAKQENDDLNLDEWPQAMNVYKDRFTKLFGMPTPSAGQRGNILTLRFSKSNHSFKNSNYYLKPDKLHFSHLTTYKGLFGIINSGTIRLYNLHNSNDPNELFLIKGIPKFKNVAENIKPYVYTFSFCNSESILNPTMWEGYGQIALNFEIVNDPMQWDCYRISSMHYGESDLVIKYAELLNEMHREFSPWEFEPDLESMLSLLAFHKEKIHNYEKEIRLLYVPFMFDDRRQASIDFHVSNIRAGITKYVELPLHVANDEKAWDSKSERHKINKDDSLPLIKITSIEFGDNEPRFSQKKLDNLRLELEDYLTAKFGYRIKVKEKLFETGVKIKE